MAEMNCDFCANYVYDDEDDRFMSSHYKECPYYKSGDEYKVVRHQM